MSDSAWSMIILIGVVAVIYKFVTSGSSDTEDRKPRKTYEPQPPPPSGRGKTFKAKR